MLPIRQWVKLSIWYYKHPLYWGKKKKNSFSMKKGNDWMNFRQEQCTFQNHFLGLKCWNFMWRSIECLIQCSINNTPIRILLPLLDQEFHIAFNLRFYLKVQLVCNLFVLQDIFPSLCFYGLPEQIVEAARYFGHKHWKRKFLVGNLPTCLIPENPSIFCH